MAEHNDLNNGKASPISALKDIFEIVKKIWIVIEQYFSSDKLVGRKITQFRCHIDPMIGNPKNAFTVGKDGVISAEFTRVGVYVKWINPSPGNDKNEAEHLIPFANVQSVKFSPEVKEEHKKK